jgi:DNA-binding HxlR family transcriptional regulator
VPEFTLDGHIFQSPVELARHAIGGKWKMPILWRRSAILVIDVLREWGRAYRVSREPTPLRR